MKARIKATGEIVEARRLCQSSQGPIWEAEGSDYYEYELDFDVQEPTKPRYTPDYWTRLEHQYAGMAMQGLMTILPNIGGLKGRTPKDEIVDIATSTSHALVQKLKEKEERK